MTTIYSRITALSVRLADRYFPILIERASTGTTISYGELIAIAQHRYPDDEDVRSAIPVSTGRKLDVIRAFCQANDLPDLASIVINQSTGETGSGYASHLRAGEIRTKVFEFDWQSKSVAFTTYVEEVRKRSAQKRHRTEAEALDMLFAHYRAIESTLPPDIKSQREYILALLMEGNDVNDAFEDAINELKAIETAGRD